ncbi:LPS assembly lipoprotein LptE [Aquisalinus flavus]|uniref:LPS-assembly lipoprotein n=1 Tax=Aquisalinus flavus TaxID=1526572 RepID=A0A8J2Y459_9PROT|nr:LPS assembly lipoprotein LptE [Aquisalinus flavus]MBD0425587.1 hypothetical protein [Aquisalinus flavus]UNE48791.1 hypothetical protein FF099_12385 [Aquisalinus flavus]GGD14850.1 hypothetical protein GCM10011342_24560 [Aquisalinus flavus]
MSKVVSMKSMLKASAALALAAMTAACGFSPLYAERGAGLQASLSGIDITRIESETDAGYLLQSELQRRFRTGAAASHGLDIELDEKTLSEAITRQATTVQFTIRLIANYELRDVDGTVVLRDSAQAVTSYGAVPSQYATLVAREEAIRVASQMLADDIEIDLVLHFKNFN